ncbi:NAD(P)-binding protein [Streptomyces sp. ST2-7A]|uniref:NAD(P)-binding protein n=1 Tax=Streptomyces sp. ST2-7A TaxID=2907214 RepID=UPI001F18B08E|nr:NAD(P)-binding protein [Streptomyces sp. ST2-7A]MCE7080472.1 NAD-binding protein [Streptomyces sp. ST2-7A]
MILYGLGRFGGHAADRLGRAGLRVLAVDWDPYRVTSNEREGVTAVFGSAEDVHFLETLPLSRARWVISAIPHPNTNLALVDGLRRHGYEGRIMLTAHTRRDVERSRVEGVDVVLDPFAEAADTAMLVLADRAPGEGGPGDAEGTRSGTPVGGEEGRPGEERSATP